MKMTFSIIYRVVTYSISPPTSIYHHSSEQSLCIQGEHGLYGHVGRCEVVLLHHLLDQLLPVLHGVLRRLCEKDLVVPRVDLREKGGRGRW